MDVKVLHRCPSAELNNAKQKVTILRTLVYYKRRAFSSANGFTGDFISKATTALKLTNYRLIMPEIALFFIEAPTVAVISAGSKRGRTTKRFVVPSTGEVEAKISLAYFFHQDISRHIDDSHFRTMLAFSALQVDCLSALNENKAKCVRISLAKQ